MNQEGVLALFARRGAILTETHAVYASGRHGSAYVNKDAIYPHVNDLSTLCRLMASGFVEDGVDVVVAPALGGIALTQWIAHHLSVDGREVLAVYAEKSGDGFALTRGYDQLVAGKRVLIAEDILTTGGSVAKVVSSVEAVGGVVIGVVALCNRGAVLAETLGVSRLQALVDVNLESWSEDECPLCKRGVPINTTVGKGREFLARRGMGA